MVVERSRYPWIDHSLAQEYTKHLLAFVDSLVPKTRRTGDSNEQQYCRAGQFQLVFQAWILPIAWSFGSCFRRLLNHDMRQDLRPCIPGTSSDPVVLLPSSGSLPLENFR
jgi:hypothetical protein